MKKNYSHCKSKGNGDNHLGNMNMIIDYGDLLTVSKGKIAYSQDWILDSSSTLHVYFKKKYFNPFQRSPGGIGSIANGSMCKIISLGTMKIKMFDGVMHNLGSVAYFPNLHRNLISISRFVIAGCRVNTT